jgi:hypothetical protein
VVFAIHFLEESPRFVPWFNAHAAPGITQELFWSVNLTALTVTTLLTLSFWITRTRPVVLAVVAWLGFLMLANAAFHVTGAVVDRGYVPGLASAVLLYLPYCAWIAQQVAQSGVGIPLLLAAALLGAIPMSVHGYRILFLGTRLF